MSEAAQFWSDFSEDYEQNAKHISESILHGFLHLLRLQEVDKILEVGCGPGNGIAVILENASASAEITACDFSSRMCELTRAKNFPRTTVLEADNESLPFPNSSFDRYIANCSLMLVNSPSKMLSEALRVLKPGGISAFTVWGPESTCSLLSITPRALKELGIPTEEFEYNMHDKAVLRNLILQAGFSKVLCFDMTHVVPHLQVDEILEFSKREPDLRKFDGTEDYDRVLKKLREIIEEILNAGNLVTFPVVVAIAFK